MSTEVLLNEFKEYSEHPYRVLSEYKKQGKKVIGMLPYYAPAELVVAAGMVPMGIWGSNKKTIALAKEYCATFYCTIAQLALEMLLDGTMDDLDGIITPTICDTLRPMSQNFRVAMEGKLTRNYNRVTLREVLESALIGAPEETSSSKRILGKLGLTGRTTRKGE